MIHPRSCQPGDLVKSKPSQRGCMEFRVDDGEGFVMFGSYDNTATVIGMGSNPYYRKLFFHVPWENREGVCVVFAEVCIDELEVIKI